MKYDFTLKTEKDADLQKYFLVIQEIEENFVISCLSDKVSKTSEIAQGLRFCNFRGRVQAKMGISREARKSQSLDLSQHLFAPLLANTSLLEMSNSSSIRIYSVTRVKGENLSSF